MFRNLALAALPACAIGCAIGCATGNAAAPATTHAQTPADWRTIATESDRKRLGDWRTAWSRALEKAQAGGHAADISGEGKLLDPDGALTWLAPPPGLYRCRTIKIGAKSQGLLDYIAYPPFDCRIRIEGAMVRLTRLNGSQRPIGVLLPQNATRSVFLGTLQLGDETRALDYGLDRERDLAAVVERIGDKRWRLVFPYPHFESLLDVMELVPKD
jgi:hypothetical protein